jgi:hypothetical protein
MILSDVERCIDTVLGNDRRILGAFLVPLRQSCSLSPLSSVLAACYDVGKVAL